MKRTFAITILIAILLLGNALPVLAEESATPRVFVAAAVTRSAVVSLTGTASAGSSVEIFRNDRSLGITVADGQGAFSLVTYLDEGINAFRARLMRNDGSFGPFSDTVFVTLDIVSPQPPVPDTTAAILGPSQFLFGSAEPGAGVGVLLDGRLVETVAVDDLGRFRTSNLDLSSGWHDFLFFTADRAGNQSIYSPLVKVLVQEIAPDILAALDRLQELSIVRGYIDGSFRPLTPVTRAQFAAFLARTQEQANVGSPAITPPSFPDVPAEYWALTAIGTAAQNGWMTGFSDGSFRPEAYITGKEAIAAIVRAAGLEREVEAAQALMTSAPWYAGYTVVGAQHGLLYPQFAPEENALRGEVALSLVTLYDLLAQNGITQ